MQRDALGGTGGLLGAGGQGMQPVCAGESCGEARGGWGGTRDCGRVGPRAGCRVPTLQEGTHWEQTGTSTGRRWGQRWSWDPRGGAGPSEGPHGAAMGSGPCPRPCDGDRGGGPQGPAGSAGGAAPACSWGVRGGDLRLVGPLLVLLPYPLRCAGGPRQWQAQGGGSAPRPPPSFSPLLPPRLEDEMQKREDAEKSLVLFRKVSGWGSQSPAHPARCPCRRAKSW